MKSGHDRALTKQQCYKCYRGLLGLLLIAVLACVVSIGSVVSGNINQPGQRSTAAGASQDEFWRQADSTTIPARNEQASPRSYRILELNEEALSRVLKGAPMEFTEAAKENRVIVSLPMPDGSFGRFQIEESPVMEPDLAAQFPEVKSYRGQGLDDPTETARFDWSPNGFHAIVLAAGGTVIIAPYAAGNAQNYISFYKEDLQEGFQPPRCEVTEAMQASTDLQESVTSNTSVGTSLRTYRLAIATTVEYTNNATYGGTKASTLTKLNTIVNLINAIYEREVAIRFQLVSGQLSIIFDTEPDGYTNSSVSTMLDENPTVLNATIGSGAYDIGHVFGLSSAGSSSGVAQVGVVCVTNKGRGASVLGIALVTGTFAIDSGLVAHEWGHQFSARHTFNSISNFCGSAGQRNPSTAFEPGSGSTLMAYPGICSPENLQSNSNSYFLGGSFDQIASHSAGSGACATVAATGNNPPTVSAGTDYTVPMGTPFTLTATGSDPDGDSVTFSWEELDVGAASPPMTDDGTRPLFRSFLANTSPSRTFPKLSDILNNTSTIGEILPSTTRSMNFRVTARDNRAAGGGVNSDAMVLTVTSAAGPFVVTSPNTAVTWTGGSTQTVMWNVAGTSSAPVNCANVRISLSTDGGSTFPIVLAASTPNDASQTITVPNVATTSARVRLEAVGNVFFDVSNVNFTIVQGSGGGGTATAGLYNPAVSAYFLRNSNTGGVANITFTYGPGSLGFLPIVGDWDGDGVETIGLYDPAHAAFFLRNSNSGGIADITFTYGPAGLGFVPIVGDWDGDGTDTIGLYSPANAAFFLRNSNSGGIANVTFTYGPAGLGFKPLVGDWNGDGVDTIGLYSPANAGFFLRNSNSGGIADITFTYGPAGMGFIALVGDWNGDETDTIGLYAPADAAFFLRNSNTGGMADITITYGPAGMGFTPLVGDWDGV